MSSNRSRKLDSSSALIYCRVSSDRQAKEGHGLDSQEHRCREYAKSKSYEVEDVFTDTFSGGGDFLKRQGMVALLHYIDKHPHRNYVVVFDDLSRFARDVAAHIRLRQEFDKRDTKIECPNFTFEDTPEGELVENIMAAQNQYHRKSNRRQVIQKMKARLEKGYWPHYPPPGYKQANDPVHGKLLKPIEPRASIIREAFEGFASDRFMTQTDVMYFLRGTEYNNGRPVYVEGVRRLLRRVVYAGYVEREEWDVSRRKGQHEALISLEVFEKVQAKLDGKCRVRTRISDKLDFALRGSILCHECRRPLTGSWSRGRSKMYRFYRCNTPSCARYNKSLNGDFVDERFKVLLESAVPRAELLELTRAIALDVWSKRIKTIDERRTELERKLTETRRQVEVFSDRIVRAIDESMVRVYEEQIVRIREEGLLIQEQLQKLGVSASSFETALEVVMGFLKDPVFIYENGDMNAKRLVLGLVFAEKLAFHHKDGFETAQKPMLIGLFEQIHTKDSQDVEMAGANPRPAEKSTKIYVRRLSH